MKIRSLWLTRIAACLIVTSLRALFATCRREFAWLPGLNGYDPDLPDRFLYCVWHDEIAFPLFMGRPYYMSALVSKHQDGSYLSESMRWLHVTPYRGSTNRGGAQAVRQLIGAAERLHITITPDGPRGPQRTMKDGIVFLASRSGQAIVPMAFGCRRGVRIKGTWTDMLLPLPFTRVYLASAQPIHVPSDLSREQLVDYTARVQQAMDDLAARLEDRIAGRTEQMPTKESPPCRNAA